MKVKKKYLEEKLTECDGDFSPQKETFDELIKKFQRSKKPNYNFLVKASQSFKDKVFEFSKMMIQKEDFPECFRETTLHMIFKGGKGRKHILSDNRFVHSKFWFPRTVEGLVVVGGLKETLVGRSSIYQIGGQPGHRSEEHVFVLKSIVARYKAQGKPLILQTSDISKFFDKEMVEDAIQTCYKRGADPKACRLWYKLNNNTRIRVKTTAGMSKSSEVGAIVGQGTMGGALVSQGVLDDGISEQFPAGGEDEVSYGSVLLGPLIFQDDVLHSVGGVKEARKANIKMEHVVKKLNLKFNEDKTFCICIGSLKQRRTIKEELAQQPLMCGSFETKLKDNFKWLGQTISSGGLAESVAATVAAREGKIRGACLEIAAIVNDWWSHIVGGMETALLLWEACCVPSLLHGAGTWVEITAATEKKINQIQNWFLRLVLQVGPGAPLASLSWDTSVLDMGLRVKKDKIMMVLHLRSLHEDTLARQIYEEQKTNKWPGLALETLTICQELQIEDCNLTQLDRGLYKKIVIAACHKKNEQNLRGLAKGKCERLNHEEYGKKDYLHMKNIHEIRQQYRTRFGLQPFAGNYSNDKRFARSGWLCKCQTAREEEGHLMSGQCPVYGDLTNNYSDLTDIDSLVQLFKEILDRRDELDKNPVGGVITNADANSVPSGGISQSRE